MDGGMDGPKSDATVGELLGALARDTGVLVRQEVQLASLEMTIKAKIVGKSAVLIVVGGALAHTGLLALLVALIVALDAVLPLWMSALVIGLFIMATGYAFVLKGLSALKDFDPLPVQTLATLRDDAAWAKDQLR